MATPVILSDSLLESAAGTAKRDLRASQTGQISFGFVPCLLTEDELTEKCEEQFTVTWNGMNRTT